jgi:hypothetical protein
MSGEEHKTLTEGEMPQGTAAPLGVQESLKFRKCTADITSKVQAIMEVIESQVTSEQLSLNRLSDEQPDGFEGFCKQMRRKDLLDMQLKVLQANFSKLSVEGKEVIEGVRKLSNYQDVLFERLDNLWIKLHREDVTIPMKVIGEVNRTDLQCWGGSSTLLF